MKRVFKRILSVLLVAVMLLTAAPLSGFVGLDIDFRWLDFISKASATDNELTPTGQCGENVYWNFDKDTGLLTISGMGYMQNYDWGKSPFCNNSYIKSIVIKNGVTSIGNAAFYFCRGLTSITVPDSVTSIGYNAFNRCTGLTSITIPDSVTGIHDYAFFDCTSLTGITVDSNNPVYDSRENCNAIIETETNTLIQGCKNTTIPDSVTSIGNDSFYFCTGLTSITVPDSVTSVGSSAFGYCQNLTSITIPDSVTSIGNYAFSNCTALKDVYYSASEEEWGKIEFGSNNDSLKNATIHYNSGSGGENPTNPGTGGCSISEDIVFLEKDEHYLFTVYDKNGNDITDKVSWSSIDQTGKVEIVKPGDIKAINEGLTTVHVSYWSEDKTQFIGSDSCDVYVGKPNELKYTYMYDTEYYFGEGGFYSDALGISNTADIYLNLKNAVKQTMDFYLQYEKYDDDFAVLDLGSFKITATVSGNDLSFSDTEYKNTYSQTFNKIPIGKSVDDLLVLYPYNLSVSSNKKPYTVSIKIESDDFETITDTFSFNISALEYKAVNEHIDFVNNNSTYRAFKTEDFASKMLPLKDDSQYIWAKYTSFDFENYYDVLFADVLVDLLKVSQFDNISFLPVVKEWVGNYKTILDAVSTMVEDDYTGYLEVTENAIDKLLKKSKFSDEGIYNDDELYQTVLDIAGNASNADKITKVFAAMDKTKQVGGFVKLGVNIFNDIVDSVNSITVINSYKDLTDNNFKTVIQKLYNNIPDSEKQAKKAVYRYINLDTAGGYTEEMFNQALSVAGNMTIDVFKSVYKKQVVSLLCNAVGKIPIGKGAELASTSAFAGVSAAFGAFATGASLGLCISDILCNNSGQAEKMGKVVAAAVYAPYVVNTLEFFENNMKAQKTATALSQFEYAFNLHKAVQIYSLTNTYDALEIQANSLIIKLVSRRDYPGAMSDIATLKSMFEKCNCFNLETVSGRAGTKTIEIKCPVDVYIYDENGTEVVRIINNKTEFAADGITVFINGSQKYVTIPANQEYSIKIIATDIGNMTYSVTEYDAAAQRKRVVKNENIALTKGTIFTGKVNEKLNSSDDSYALICGEKIIYPTQSFDVIESDMEFPTLSICKPSTTTINYGDAIILHAELDGTLSEGERIEWTADNVNFKYSPSADGFTCKISPKSSGKTTFTATIYDRYGNVICYDTQKMTAKAGLWQKIIAFFKKLFGLTKTIS